jgi:PAS domain-containing protein
MTSVDAEVTRLKDHPEGSSRAASMENKKRLHDLLHALPAAVYTIDAAGRITYYNKAAAELWSCEPVIRSAPGGSMHGMGLSVEMLMLSKLRKAQKQWMPLER